MDHTWVTLDCFLTTHNWTSLFPRCVQTSLPRLGLDHVPFWLEADPHMLGSSPFWFEDAWETTVSFNNLIREWWISPTLHGCGAFVMAKKLTHLKHELRSWARKGLGLIFQPKNALLLKINSLDILKEVRQSSINELAKESDLRANINTTLQQEVIYCKQRFRNMWLKGDASTKFFHVVANGQRNRIIYPGSM